MTKEEYIERIKKYKCVGKFDDFIYLNKEIENAFSILIEENGVKYKCMLKRRTPYLSKYKDFLKNNEMTHILLKEDECFYYFNWFNEDEWKETKKPLDLVKFRLMCKQNNIVFEDICYDNILVNKLTGDLRFIDLKKLY
jgi:hypothetical protein